MKPSKKYLESQEFQALYTRASEVFSPSAPIDQRNLFAGRLEQLSVLIDTLHNKGQHAVIYGERGVGKTSLVSILSNLNVTTTVRQNCHQDDTFSRLWARAFAGVTYEVPRPQMGFTAEVRTEIASMAQHLRDSQHVTPDEVIAVLRRFRVPLAFVFDEFDQLEDKKVAQSFAEVIKALSDYAVPSKLVLVGVGDTVDSLIGYHASVERAIRQVRMPRMKTDELGEIITKALTQLGMKCTSQARARIVRLSQGLPHYVHSLGLQAVRSAIHAATTDVTMEAVDTGINQALGHASQSLLNSYLKATSSPQKESLYKHVLLSCALAKTGDLSYFTSAAVRPPLKEMGRPLEIPAFASHLNKFASGDRGEVLQKSGQNRRYRYRFKNPLLQPFFVMRGVADKLIDADKVDKLLTAHGEKKE